ncbi:tetratricopeptide repeat protein [Psychromonas ossibalaenae]|uniref:tetratricopeptide repeat protein n=1 Tax=Psychromonas ossibalaenae TaxID=444922 RepID=UPI00035EC6DA|nr:tetratricopeptide repeat protein [Psychromonas ossibalaenae]
MSIINKMHQDFEKNRHDSPVISGLPAKKTAQKSLLFILIVLLFGSALGLSYLIFIQEKVPEQRLVQAAEIPVPTVPLAAEPKVAAEQPLKTPVVIEAKQTIIKELAAQREKVPAPASFQAAEKNKSDSPLKTKAKAPEMTAKTVPVKEKKKPAAEKALLKKADPVKKIPHLEIKKAQLTNPQLAQIHLKEAEKAKLRGELDAAADKRLQALSLQPDLNEVRKSAALYYYGQGENNKAVRLLKKGAQVSPDYPDFNLMLSRIALKSGDERKAYLYLHQHPPKIEGNLDYYVSYAILAQKFKKFEQSESLFKSLLSQRPDNGRWRMSLAIAQDKQGKTELAVSSYKSALLQTDLSSKAKAYIDQRLTYLAEK